MKKRAPKKRPAVAFFVSELEAEYSYLLCKGVVDGAKNYDLNLLIFPGKTVNSPYRYQYQFNVIYDLINPGNVDALILPMSIFHTFSNREEIIRFCRRYSPLPIVSITIPVESGACILINNKKGVRDLINHLIRDHGRKRIAFLQGTPNNFDAEERYAAYLEVLKSNNIPFNPELVCPGDFTAFSALKAMRLLLDIKKVPFDAVVAANDDMALAAVSILRERGIRIPEEVSVVGFDNIEASWFSRPGLTTIRQPLYEMGQKAVELAFNLIHGGKTSTVVLNTEIVIRESCGCRQTEVLNNVHARFPAQPGAKQQKTGDFMGQTMDKVKKRFFQYKTLLRFLEEALPVLLNPESFTADPALIQLFRDIFEEHNFSGEESLSIQILLARLWDIASSQSPNKDNVKRIGDFFINLHQILLETSLKKSAQERQEHDFNYRTLRGVLDIMVPHIDQKEAAVAAAVPQLKKLGIERCRVYLYEDEIYCPDYQSWVAPENVIPAAGYPENGLKQVLKKKPSIPTQKILSSEYLFTEDRYSMIINPLFFLEHQMGFILCEFHPENRFLYENLFIEMRCVLKFTYLLKAKEQIETKLRDALQELKKKNKQLKTISQTDELTGLWNRRGFLNHGRQKLQKELSAKKEGLLFYADLDELKAINDTYGHEEGDYALCQAANILRKTFRREDIIARLGGDEFTILTINTSLENLEGFQQRLGENLDEYNNKTKKPYKISVCMGAVPFSCNGQKSIEQLIAEADNRLYEQKRTKKQPETLSSP